MQSALISVIIPVYNVEAYLDTCISSIVNQTYTNLEIIIVDDGSQDLSPQICDKWSRKDERIKVIHQANRGSGFARNHALKISTGEYIAFVDSDDYIAPTMFEYLLSFFSSEIDIVECEYCTVENDNAEFSDITFENEVLFFSTQEAMREHIKDHYFKQVIWNKLYRKKTIDNIFFPIDKKIDDEFWTYKVLGNAEGLIHTTMCLYAYRQQSNSIMHSLSNDRRMEAIEARIQRYFYLQKTMPFLEAESLSSIWMTCLYQGQLLLKLNEKQHYTTVLRGIETTLSKFPPFKLPPNLSLSSKISIKIASKSLYAACKLRNIFNIGI